MNIKIKKSKDLTIVETVDGTFKFKVPEQTEDGLDFGKGNELSISQLLMNTFSNALNNPILEIEVENE